MQLSNWRNGFTPCFDRLNAFDRLSMREQGKALALSLSKVNYVFRRRATCHQNVIWPVLRRRVVIATRSSASVDGAAVGDGEKPRALPSSSVPSSVISRSMWSRRTGFVSAGDAILQWMRACPAAPYVFRGPLLAVRVEPKRDRGAGAKAPSTEVRRVRVRYLFRPRRPVRLRAARCRPSSRYCARPSPVP